ncbi:MAG: oligosaccharide flippase family protein [Parcubacteria group bacterium]|nr:oligosaccharide flippase family protein [Parcubacteria group bacterium]
MISIYFFWLAIWVFVQSLRAIVDLLAQIYEKFVLISISNIVEVVVKLIVAVIFLKTVGLTVITVLLIYIISKFASFVFSIFPMMFALRGLLNVVAAKKSILWNIIKKHGKWEIVRHITSSISVSIKPWFIKILLSTEAVAIYSLAQTVFSVISQAIPIKNVIFPVIAKKINDRFASSLLVQKANKYSILFYLCAIVAFFVFGEYLIVLFFPKYEASVFLIKLMLFVLLTTTITAHQAILLYGLRQQRFLLTSQTLIGVFSRLTILPLCLFVFGLEGIVFEMLISSTVMAFLAERFLRKRFEMSTWSFKSLFVFDNYDKWFLGKVMLKIKRILRFKTV